MRPGRTAAQRRILDQIGRGDECPRMTPATRKALLAAGLIEQCGEKVIGRDQFGTVAVPVYQMPISVHRAWAEAVAEEAPPGSSRPKSV